METLDEARKLSHLMVDIGKMAGRQVVALLSDMNQPLGEAVGNALEVVEAIDTLHGGGPADFREHCLHVCAHMLVLGQVVSDLESGRRMAERALTSGEAFTKFRVLVDAQGGDVSYVDNPEKFPKAKYVEVVEADRSGYLSQVNARIIGETAVQLGAGRAKKSDSVDHTVGFLVHRKIGDHVDRNWPLITIYADDKAKLVEVRDSVRSAFGWSDAPFSPLPLFYD